MGVSDIRVIPAAQFRGSIDRLELRPELLNAHPILKYKIDHINGNGRVRGLDPNSSHHCALVLDDMAVVKDYHFPCIIYLRERGQPIGKLGPNTRQEREDWFRTHDTHTDSICRTNCLDFCETYNRKYEEYHGVRL